MASGLTRRVKNLRSSEEMRSLIPFCSMSWGHSLNYKAGERMDYHLQVLLLDFVNLAPLKWERVLRKRLPHPARIHLKAVICQMGWKLVFLHKRNIGSYYCWLWLPHPAKAEQHHSVQIGKPTKQKSHHPKLQQMKITDFSQTQWLAGQFAIAI